MLRTIDLRGTKLRPAQLRRVLPRGGTDVAAVVDKKDKGKLLNQSCECEAP